MSGCIAWTDLPSERLELLEAREPAVLLEEPVAISYSGGTLGGLMGATREELEATALGRLEAMFPNNRKEVPSLAKGATAVRVVTTTKSNNAGFFLLDALLPIYVWNNAVSTALVFDPSGEEVLRVEAEVQGHTIIVWYLPIPINFENFWDTERQSILECLGRLEEHPYWDQVSNGSE
jgi:hypothetical protein